jgi:preprotein translocase subunit SecD
MEDERRKFLLGLLALGGGAVALPEIVEAVQTKLNLTRPIEARFTHQSTVPYGDHVDLHSQFEEIGANDVKRVTAMVVSEYPGETTRRRHVMQHISLFEHSAHSTPASAHVIAAIITATKLDANHEQIQVTSVDPKNGVQNRSLGPIATPAVRKTGEGMTPDELIEEFYMPKVRGGKP